MSQPNNKRLALCLVACEQLSDEKLAQVDPRHLALLVELSLAASDLQVMRHYDNRAISEPSEGWQVVFRIGDLLIRNDKLQPLWLALEVALGKYRVAKLQLAKEAPSE